MSGLAYLVVGVAHDAATFTVYHMGFDKLSAAMSGLAVLLFVATGSSIILAGLLSMYCSVGLKRHEPWARTTAIGAGVYSALLGAGSLAVIRDNPFVYVLLAAGVIELYVLVPYRMPRTTTT
jgi:hypothetical protein